MNRFIVVLIPALLLGVAACSGTHPRPEAQASTRPPQAVDVIAASAIDWPNIYEAAGTVRARTSATVASKVMGYIREVKVQPGDRVAAGQLLVSIDARDLESSLLQAKAAEQEAHSGIAEADNGIAAAKAQLSLAQATFRRMDELFSKKSISNQEFDEAQARLHTAEASYQMTISRRTQLDARIAQARQGVASASVMHSYSEIRAPFAGIVTDKRAESGQMATPGAPLLTIEQAGAYRLEAPVEESMLGSVRLGQDVSIALESANQTVSGKITEVVPAVDPGSRAFLVKASLPSLPGLRSGSFGRMRLIHGAHRALVIPAGAVKERGQLQSVFVVENGIARTRMITGGAQREDRQEVLSGLDAGEKVIFPRPPALVDGTPVETRK